MENDDMLRMRLGAELKAALQELAKKEDRTLSNFIRIELEKLVAKAKKNGK